jgi:hypothetical protein
MEINTCIGCKNKFMYNPIFVPCIVKDEVENPICEICFNDWNQIHRVNQGLPVIPIAPMAYKE